MVNYDDLTKEELLELAKDRGIVGRNKLNKAELVLALQEDDAEVDELKPLGLAEEEETQEEVETPKPKKSEYVEPEETPTPNNNEYEKPLIEQFAERRDRYAKLLRISPTPVQVRKTDEPVRQIPLAPTIYRQTAVLDTTGLGGAQDWESSYSAPEIKKELFKETFTPDTPRGKEVLKAEQERQNKSSYGE